MTPYEKAEQILDDIVEAADEAGICLPERRYAVVGEPVIETASLVITLTGMTTPADMPVRCGVPQMGSFSIVLARDCAAAMALDGSTVVDEAIKVARQQSEDGELFWNYANDFAGTAFLETRWDIGFVVIGGLAITSLMLETGID